MRHKRTLMNAVHYIRHQTLMPPVTHYSGIDMDGLQKTTENLIIPTGFLKRGLPHYDSTNYTTANVVIKCTLQR